MKQQICVETLNDRRRAVSKIIPLCGTIKATRFTGGRLLPIRFVIISNAVSFATSEIHLFKQER